MEKLTKIKSEITTDNYLTETSLDNLQQKIKEVQDITAEITKVWDNTLPTDAPDNVGWETKREEAINLQNEIIQPIQEQINRLKEKEKPKLEIESLKSIHDQLKTSKSTFSTEKIKTLDKEALQSELKIIKELKESYTQKYQALDKGKFTKEQLTAIQTQKTDVGHWTQSLTNKMEEQICKLTIDEQKEVTHQAERERDEKLQLLEAEQKAKNAALQLIKDLQKQITDLQQAPPEGTTKMADAIEELQQKRELMEKERDEIKNKLEHAERKRREADEGKKNAEEELQKHKDTITEDVHKLKGAIGVLKNQLLGSIINFKK